jgi:hypothetical protein
VHSFRTVIADMGADVGIIISANGFQRGAMAAAALTNIRLMTWEEFQQAFETRWTTAKVVEVDAHAARVVACTKTMPGFPTTAIKRPEYLKDLIQSEDRRFRLWLSGTSRRMRSEGGRLPVLRRLQPRLVVSRHVTISSRQRCSL